LHGVHQMIDQRSERIIPRHRAPPMLEDASAYDSIDVHVANRKAPSFVRDPSEGRAAERAAPPVVADDQIILGDEPVSRPC
jgi:hypothetical protein